MLKPSRRTALLSIGAALFLGAAGSYRFLSLGDGDRETLAAIARVLLGEALPAEAASRSAALSRVVRGFDTAVAGLTPSVQAEVAQLLRLLKFPPTRALVAGVWVPWHEADDATISNFLNSWRHHRLLPLRSAYDALHQLVYAAWYGNPASWPALQYPGPPAYLT